MIILFGAAGNLGNAIIKELSDSNLSYGLTYNSNLKEINNLTKNLNNKPLFIKKCDVRKRSQVDKVFDFCNSKKIKIDSVINNFAYTFDDNKKKGTIENIDEVKKIFDVNYFGTANIFNALIEKKIYKKNNVINIINILSNSLKTMNASNIHYIASKSAVEILGRYHAINNSRQFRVNAIAPGFMLSKITKLRFKKDKKKIISKTPSRKLIRADEVAKLIIFVLSNKSINGETIYIDGGRHLT